jgi:Tol biopolymer transport system component
LRVPLAVFGAFLALGAIHADSALRLTSASGDDDEPCWSPDGEWIVYQSRDAQGKPDLWVVPAAGGKAQRITDGPGYNCFPSWSPDGSKIVFASDPDGEYDLYVIEREGGGWSRPRNLTSTPRVREFLPSYSPDGKWIAYCAWELSGYRLGDGPIYVMPAEGGERSAKSSTDGVEGAKISYEVVGRQLITSEYGATEPAWSRDGATIAFARSFIWKGGHQLGLALVAADAALTADTEAQQLGQLAGYPAYAPAFSPAADLLAFTTSRGEAWDLWVLPKPYDGEPVRLTDHPANDVNPAWSPDGTKIAFASNRAGGYDIYVMDVQGKILALGR